MSASKGKGQRNTAIGIIVVLIILLLLLPKSTGTGGTSTITTTSNGSTITTTVSNSSTSSTFSGGVCANVAPIYQVSGGPPYTQPHRQQGSWFFQVSSYSGSGLVPNVQINIAVQLTTGGSNVFSQTYTTGSQTPNYGTFFAYVAIANPGYYSVIASWQQPSGIACSLFSVQII